MKYFLPVAILSLALAPLIAQDEETPPDNSDGLPAEYAEFLIGAETLSPDESIAVIYPKLEVGDDETAPGATASYADYLVQLKPFQILAKLETEWPYFQNKNHGSLSASWATDQRAVLVTLGSKWGPGEIFLFELRDGKVTRATSLLAKVHDLLVPDYKKAKAEPYNDSFDFIFETDADPEEMPVCEFADPTHIRIRGHVTTDPKSIAGLRAWEANVAATWDISQAKFTSQKVTRTFAGVRKEN